MDPFKPKTKRPLLGVSLALLSSCSAWAGMISVTPVVTTSGSIYHYNYSVTNGTGNDLDVLDIVVKPGTTTVQNIAAPSGFTTAYDPILGLASFLENTSSFGPAAISGFTFDSPLAPAATTFNTTGLDPNFNLVLSSGSTIGPVTPASVAPEPGYFPVLVVFCLVILFVAKQSHRQSGTN